MNRDLNWTVLLIGGASGTGKSSLAYEIARFYGVNVLEGDDVHLAVEAVTTKETFPAIHDWETSVNWKDTGVDGNVKWLIDVSREMMPVLKKLVDRHVEDRVPIIIEGDFIHPELAKSFDTPQVKSLFVNETDIHQIVRNYAAREGDALQHFRAEISVAYGKWIADSCHGDGIRVIEPRPWDTILERVLQNLL
ncbi:MAG: hypothetical protein GXY67_08320 [Clostridiales bacterium]|nr:hypothetical protein [Clostridiales bacterium]